MSTSSDGQWYYAVYDALEQLPVGQEGDQAAPEATSTGPGAGPSCSDPSSESSLVHYSPLFETVTYMYVLAKKRCLVCSCDLP